MSTEPELEPDPLDTTSDPGDSEPDTPPIPEEPPPPSPPEPPPAPDLPGSQLVFEPGMYYSIDNVCLTQDMGGGAPCPHLNEVTTSPMVYSNAGRPNITCYPCGKQRTFLSAVKLDPQPQPD